MCILHAIRYFAAYHLNGIYFVKLNYRSKIFYFLLQVLRVITSFYNIKKTTKIRIDLK